MVEDEDPTAAKRERERKGEIDYEFVLFDDFPRAFLERLDGLYVRPVVSLQGGITVDDKPGTFIIDAKNRLEVVSSPYGIGSAGGKTYSGTFTKNATGAVGTITVTPHVDDILYFMYGYVLIGPDRAAGGLIHAGISGDPNISDRCVEFLRDAAVAANEIFNIPGLGAPATGVSTTVGPYTPMLCMMLGDNHSTEIGDTSTISTTGQSFFLSDGSMANTETYTFFLSFLSINNVDPTVVVGEGTVA